jgi:hypothetical protein
MRLTDLIDSELLECQFGCSWVCLVFSKRVQSEEQQYWLSTDNHVSDRPLRRDGADAEVVVSQTAQAVFASFERRVTGIESIAEGWQIAFEGGRSIYICYAEDPIDNLAMLTNQRTGEWVMIS